MNRAEFAQELAKDLGTSVSYAEEVVDRFIHIMGRTLANREDITFSNFGSLKVKLPRRLHSMGACIDGDASIADTLLVRFRPADRLMEAVRAGDPQVNFQKRPKELPRAS